jgi:lysozyme family protein
MGQTIGALIDGVIAREGGYSNHPADRGGPTRWGVTEAVARANGYAGDMRDYPREAAAALYRARYWETPGFDRIAPHAPDIAAELFDTGINMGPATATAFLRRALNALNRGAADYADIAPAGPVDGALIAALTGFIARRGRAGEAVLLRAIEALQAERYIRISALLKSARPMKPFFTAGCGRASARMTRRQTCKLLSPL